MTTNVTRTIINQGPSNFVLQMLIQSDGLDGELMNYVIWDPAQDSVPPINPWNPSTQVCSLMQAWHNQSWFDIVVSYNALEPTPVWVLTRDTDPYSDFRFFGGVLDRAGLERDGKILISTIGLAGVLSLGSCTLAFRKNQ